jgi:3-hydroxymyristoyl/3-hydroxydecanoyl-(acyl carrier protein) dehydratase
VIKMSNPTSYDVQMIKKILPHRTPFLFVDRVVECIGSDKIIAEKVLLPDEWYFSGHFPGRPIMPGVLVSEALAQTCGLLLGLKGGGRNQLFFLASLNIKFSSPARPGETLHLEADLKKKFGGLFLFDVSAYADRRRIAFGTLSLAEEK